MTDPTLEEIARRAEAATAGPWLCAKQSNEDGSFDYEIWSETAQMRVITLSEEKDNTKAGARIDSNFIAHARTDIPYLLSRLREAEAANARLREALRPFEHRLDMIAWDHTKFVDDANVAIEVTLGDLRRARADLDEKEKG